MVISSFERELGSVDQVGTLRSGLAGNAQVHLGGDLVKLQAVLQGLTTSQVESTALSLIVSLFVLMVLTRRIIPALIVLLPIGVATLWVVGSMVLFGLKWNVLTVMVTALTIGIGIDYSIHVWRRFEIEMENNQGKPWKAMETVISTTGVALMLSAGTTVCGFLVLLFSPMPVVQDFGLVTAITVVFSLILSIFFLPVLLAMNATMSESNGNSDGQSDQ
jgi:predicted RND superfamily exporter protein